MLKITFSSVIFGAQPVKSPLKTSSLAESGVTYKQAAITKSTYKKLLS